MQPICSICIPTWNRASYLETLLASIVSQPVFTSGNKIELVISDNASTDSTRQVVEKYKYLYSDKIIYLRHDEKVSAMKNFYSTFSAANGLFLKLCNDTCEFVSNSLEEMIEFIENKRQNAPTLFFLNQGKNNPVLCHTVNDFVKSASYYSTWSASFGLWKQDLVYLKYFQEKEASQIAQTYILLKLLADGKNICINDKVLFKVADVKKKGGYNIAEVFGYNYLGILKEFVQYGYLSQDIYKKEKKKILLKHINYFYFDLDKRYAFEKSGYFKWLWEDYKYNFYFYISYLLWNIKKIKCLFRSVKK